MRWAWAIVAGVSIVACARTDGAPLDPATLGIHACASDLDCGPGRHCADDGTCAIDCLKSADCSIGMDPNAPNDRECSACGRCVAKGTRDTRCLSAVDQPCATTSDCTAVLGSQYVCGGEGLCVRQCTDDTACHDIGRGWGCLANICVRKCFHDAECWYHGWSYSCDLPPDVQKANEDAPKPTTFAACKKGGSPYKPSASSDPPSAKYQGTWGWLVTSAVRVDNVPIITRLNSVNIQLMLVKTTWSGADLAMTIKWCTGQVKNFAENDGPYFDLFKVVIPDLNIDSVVPVTITANAVPALAAGAAFDTSTMLDLRGAKLANPLTDPLPTYKDLTNQWDEDRDGHPGMTANVTGGLTGELYQAQRTAGVFHVGVVDAGHMHGLFSAQAAAAVLGATDMMLINDSVTSAHPDASRSYFQAIRLDDDASCNDVIRVANIDGSWLAFQPHFDPAHAVTP